MADQNIIIEVENLHKEFSVDESGSGLWGSVKALFHRRKKIINAVDGVDFAIRRGEFVGYVGENGAGKSTTIKILTGILVPTSGVARVNGIVPYEERQKNAMNIGVVFGQRTQLWWDLPVRESFEMLRVIFRVPKNEFTATMKRLNEALNLEPLLIMPVRKLSLGQRMRCDIAASLLHRPDVLFLDEPTIGLDVLAKENIRTFLAEINREQGTTIILTTHDMNDIEQLCGRIIILDHGKAVFDGETSALKSRFGSDKLIEVEFHDIKGVGERLEKIEGITLIREEGHKLWLRYANGADGIGGLIGDMAREYQLKDLSVKEPSVESIIRTIYQKRVTLPKYESETGSR